MRRLPCPRSPRGIRQCPGRTPPTLGPSWRLTAALIGLHLTLLLAALPDYMVSNDSGFHVALARQYAEHGVYFWDTIHYAPAHRPNLQGPALHVAIGVLGRALGGTGDDYVRANALLAVAGWLAAVGTVAFFASRFSDLAALLAVALFAGSMFASGSYRVNIPSGWMFVATPWAIHFFLDRRLLLATVLTAVACYTHLGGFATAPLGLVIAALLAGRLRDLVRTAAGVLVLTAPYWIHFLRSLPWYVGRKGDTAVMIDPFVHVSGAIGLAAALRSPRRNAFLIAWAAAPLGWLAQDPTRFLLQWPLVGAVLGGIVLARWLEGRPARFRAVATAALVLVTTLPGLGGELMWLLARYPRMIDWPEMRTDAMVVREGAPRGRIVQGFGSWIPSAIAVWDDIEAEKGHWIEVRPRPDPAEELSVGDKLYVLAIPPDDDVLASWAARDWVRPYGGGRWSTVLDFPAPPRPEEAAATLQESWARDASWIASSCEANTLGNPIALFVPGEVARRRARRRECQRRMTRLQVGALLEAYALEAMDPALAREWRQGAFWLGWIAALVADESTLDFRTLTAHQAMREDMQSLARAATAGADLTAPLDRLLVRYVGPRRDEFL